MFVIMTAEFYKYATTTTEKEKNNVKKAKTSISFKKK